MDETIKQNITKVVLAVVMFVLLLLTITANSKYKKLENEVDGYKYEIATLEDKNKEYEGLIESYKETQLADKAIIAEQETTISEQKSQIKTLNSKINTLNVEIVTLTNERDKANNTINELNQKITLLNNDITTNKNTIEDLTNKLTTANNQVSTLTLTNTNLNKEVTKLEEKLSSTNSYHVVNSEVELLEALKKDGNIILNTDIIMSNEVVIKDKHLSIDLNGYNLVVTTIGLNNTNLDIKDSKSIGKVSVVGDNEDLLKGIKIDNKSTLRITNGNFEGKNLLQVEGTLLGVNPTFITAKDDTIVKGESSKVELFNYPTMIE